MILKYLGMISLLILAGPAAAGTLAGTPVVFESGKWKVHRVNDAMTDKTSCVAVFDDNFGVQLSPGTLYIHIPGGPQSLKYRLDEYPPYGPLMVSDLDRKIGSVEISVVQALLSAHRLRYEVYTILDRLETGDLDITGIAEAYANVQSGCSGEPVKSQTAAAPADRCSESMRGKMKKNGLSDKAINEICVQ